MTVNNDKRKEIAVWDNVTTEFSYPQIQEADNLTVSLVDDDGSLVETIASSKYTLSNPDGVGICTITDAPTLAIEADNIVLLRTMEITQELNLGLRDFPPEDIEDEFDKQTMIDQQVNEQLSRGVQSSILDESGTPILLPTPATGEFPVWTADGNFENSGTTVAQITTDVAAAAASAAAALVSENNASDSEDATAADLVLTNADVVSTNADVVLTNADVVLTGLDVDATNADVVITNADVVLTNADVVLADQAVVDATAQAVIAREGWEGTYNAGTTYAENEKAQYNGSSFISLQDGNLGNLPDPLAPNTAFWSLTALKGTDGTGTVVSVVAGTGIDNIDSSDPTNPIINATVQVLPIEYINSLVAHVDDDSVSVAAGVCRNKANTADITIVLNADVTAVLSASTTYYVNVDSVGVSTISTSVATGTNRNLASFFTDSAADIVASSITQALPEPFETALYRGGDTLFSGSAGVSTINLSQDINNYKFLEFTISSSSTNGTNTVTVDTFKETISTQAQKIYGGSSTTTVQVVWYYETDTSITISNANAATLTKVVGIK